MDNDVKKINEYKKANAASGQFSGAAFIQQMLGGQGGPAAKPKAQAAPAKDEVPYGDERFIEGVVAQLGSE